MENNNKYKKIIIILSVILVVLLLAFGGLYLYRKFVVLRGIERTNIKIQHGEVDNKNKQEEKVVLNEEDVKNWLNAHKLIDFYFVLNEVDFDINNVDNKFYSNFLGFNLLFGGLNQNAVENITLTNEKYNYQYTYPITFIKKLLNDYLNIGIDKIDVNIMNETFKEYANFSMDNNMLTVKVVATGLDNYNTTELNTISLNNDNNIVINYNIKDCTGPNGECIHLKNREVVLKKTDNGYNIIKAYKVES